MALTAGTKLGPYEILSPAGAGGMGEVYRARDTRLDRTVAVKVLSARLADRPDLQKRFEREARTISKLTHPHVCALYDVGQQEGVDFLVMEYLEGETLSHRLQRGPLPMDQTLKYGIEIAAALETAHRQGIVHRDLKPGNVMLTKSGAKLMDFGLAKLAEQPAPVAVALSEMDDAPTLPSQEKSLTEEGMIMGTFWIAYVSNETGRDEIYIRPVGSAGGRKRISTEGGTWPSWARNGRELFFLKGDKLAAITLNTEGSPAGRERAVLDAPRLGNSQVQADSPFYDVLPDGEHFVMLLSPQYPSPTHYNVVVNWFEELKQLAPAR